MRVEVSEIPRIKTVASAPVWGASMMCSAPSLFSLRSQQKFGKIGGITIFTKRKGGLLKVTQQGNHGTSGLIRHGQPGQYKNLGLMDRPVGNRSP